MPRRRRIINRIILDRFHEMLSSIEPWDFTGKKFGNVVYARRGDNSIFSWITATPDKYVQYGSGRSGMAADSKTAERSSSLRTHASLIAAREYSG